MTATAALNVHRHQDSRRLGSNISMESFWDSSFSLGNLSSVLPCIPFRDLGSSTFGAFRPPNFLVSMFGPYRCSRALSQR